MGGRLDDGKPVVVIRIGDSPGVAFNEVGPQAASGLIPFDHHAPALDQ